MFNFHNESGEIFCRIIDKIEKKIFFKKLISFVNQDKQRVQFQKNNHEN